MRTFIFSLIFLISIGLSAFTVAYILPHYYYHITINKNHQSNWYALEKYSPLLIKPSKGTQIKSQTMSNENLWQKFHMSTVNIPLPVRNPFYFVVPELIYNKKNKSTKFGITILNAEDRKLFEVYFLPSISFPNHLGAQEIFTLPLVENIIKQKSIKRIWEDVLTKNLDDWNISWQEMVYNLYLMYFRSKLFQDNIKSIKKIAKTTKGIVEINYKDLNFDAEIIYELRGSSLFSFIMLTRKDNEDARAIRNKYINETEYISSTPSLQDILLNEFKSLSYEEQVDHEGMLYLTSAWSHKMDNVEVIKKIIFYLERGYKNNKQLEPFYRYAYYRFNKIFSNRHIEELNLPDEIILKRNIELEEARNKQRDLIKEQQKVTPTPKRDIEQEYENLIESTGKKRKANLMRID